MMATVTNAAAHVGIYIHAKMMNITVIICISRPHRFGIGYGKRDQRQRPR